MNKLIKLGGVAIGASALSACSTTPIDESSENSKKMIGEAHATLDELSKLTKMSSNATAVDDDYIVGKKFDVSSRRQILPSFFRDTYTFNKLDPVTFIELISYVNKVAGIDIEISDDAANHMSNLGSRSSDKEEIDLEDDDITADISINPLDFISGYDSGLPGSELLFHVSYEGDLKGFLDSTLRRVNLSWEWRGDYVEVFHTKEQTFSLDQDLATVSMSSSMSGGSGSEHDFDSTNDFDAFTDELSESIENILSSSGKYSISRNLSAITVVDTPSNLRRVERYIDNINKMASKQVMLRVQVFDIESNNSGDYGIDWNILFENSSRMSGGLASAFLPDGDSLFNVKTLGSSMDASAAIKALSERRNVTTTINTNIHTTNGRPVPFSVGDDIEYIKNIERSIDENGNRDTTFNTDNMKTGFTLNVLPRITSQGKISMSMGMDISEGDLRNVILGDIETNLPSTQARSFIQRVLSGNGDPIMLAGFERNTEENSDKRISESISWLAGGSNASSSRKVMTVIVITPYIMR